MEKFFMRVPQKNISLKKCQKGISFFPKIWYNDFCINDSEKE